MRYRNVEGVRMTEQTDREHHNANGNKKEDAQVARGVCRVEPSTLQRKTQRKNTKRRHNTWVLRKPGFELKPNHVCKQRLKRKMKSATRMMKGGGRGGGGEGEGGRGGWVQVRRGKNPRQGESLDKDQRQNKQYNYEQARSTRHAGRPADFYFHINMIYPLYIPQKMLGFKTSPHFPAAKVIRRFEARVKSSSSTWTAQGCDAFPWKR